MLETNMGTFSWLFGGMAHIGFDLALGRGGTPAICAGSWCVKSNALPRFCRRRL